MEELYDMEEFQEKFDKFMEENEWGTSVYYILYEKNMVEPKLKEFILKMKYGYEKDLQEIADKYIPPFYMKNLRDLVEYGLNNENIKQHLIRY